jgi:hypothetical protein
MCYKIFKKFQESDPLASSEHVPGNRLPKLQAIPRKRPWCHHVVIFNYICSATELEKSKVSDPLANSGHAAFSVTSKTFLIVGELSLRNLNKQNTVQ